MLNFGLSVYAKFSEILKDWNHELNIFEDEIPTFLNNYFNLYYKHFYKIVITNSDLEIVKKALRLRVKKENNPIIKSRILNNLD